MLSGKLQMSADGHVVPLWSGHYIGLPYKENGRMRDGIDDWGLVRLCMAEQANVALATYQGMTHYDILTDLTKSDYWRMISQLDAQMFDIVAFRFRPVQITFGLCLGDGNMLYAPRRNETCITSYTTEDWQECIVGIHRYKTVMNMDEIY